MKPSEVEKMTIKISGRCVSSDEDVIIMANGQKCWTIIYIDLFSFDSNNLTTLKNKIDNKIVSFG